MKIEKRTRKSQISKILVWSWLPTNYPNPLFNIVSRFSLTKRGLRLGVVIDVKRREMFKLLIQQENTCEVDLKLKIGGLVK